MLQVSILREVLNGKQKNDKENNEIDSKKKKWNEITSQKRHNNFVNIKSGAWRKKDFYQN